MKSKILKFSLPIGMGIVLLTITVSGLITTSLTSCLKETTCASAQCAGTNGHCYSCSAGSYCTTSPSGNCSTPVAGVYCCTGSGGGGGGCTPTGCPASAPWKCGGYCYVTPPSGNHACTKCP